MVNSVSNKHEASKVRCNIGCVGRDKNNTEAAPQVYQNFIWPRFGGLEMKEKKVVKGICTQLIVLAMISRNIFTIYNLFRIVILFYAS